MRLPRRSKYGNRRTARGFMSQREEKRYDQLALLEMAGKITDLEKQVPFKLLCGDKVIGKIILDFTYIENGETIYEDVKSPPTITALFKWKAKHFEAQYGKTIRIVM